MGYLQATCGHKNHVNQQIIRTNEMPLTIYKILKLIKTA